MLVVTRRFGESLWIGDDIKVRVFEKDEHQVKLGVEAPGNVRIDREEIRRARGELEHESLADTDTEPAHRTQEKTAHEQPQGQPRVRYRRRRSASAKS